MKTLILLLTLSCAAMAKDWTDNQIVDAIYKAEGKDKAQYLYGIRSVKYKDAADASRICLKTVQNNRKRFKKQTEYKDYLDFLASRYAPTKGKLSRAEKRVNGHWKRNVLYFLRKNQ